MDFGIAVSGAAGARPKPQSSSSSAAGCAFGGGDFAGAGTGADTKPQSSSRMPVLAVVLDAEDDGPAARLSRPSHAEIVVDAGCGVLALRKRSISARFARSAIVMFAIPFPFELSVPPKRLLNASPPELED